jgi:DNA polymerase-2
MKRLGWILDLYQKDGQMIIWLKTRDGKCHRLTDKWQPQIHVSGTQNELLNLACQPFITKPTFADKFVNPGDSKRTRVLSLNVKSESQARVLAKRIQQYGNYSKFRLYDVDVPFTQMYLYKKNLFPLALVQVDSNAGNIHWSLKDSREAINYELPSLRLIRLLVQTKKARGVQRFDDKIESIMIIHENETTTIDSGDETTKLLNLVDVFNQIDPDVVLTDGGDSFIFPYLARLAEHHEILDQLKLDREGTPLRVQELQGHSYFSYSKILFRQTTIRLLGRLHIDEANAFFVNDCGQEGLFEVARTCIIPIQRASRTTIGTSMTSLQLYHAVKAGVLIPWNKNEPEEFKNGNELVVADRGGFIFEPHAGIHDHIGELDFSSLYPTIMFKENLSGETVNCKCCSNSTKRVPELGFNICERWMGIVPRSLDVLLRKRAAYKRLKEESSDPPIRLRYDQRQAALKWILVCS